MIIIVGKLWEISIYYSWFRYNLVQSNWSAPSFSYVIVRCVTRGPDEPLGSSIKILSFRGLVFVVSATLMF